MIGVCVVDEQRVPHPDEASAEGSTEVGLDQHRLRRAEGDAVGGQGSTRSQAPASAKLCVVMIVVCPAATRPASASSIRDVDTTSSPVRGSSSRSTSACWARPWATKVRCRCPPDNRWICRSARSSRSRTRMASSMAAWSSGPSRPRMPAVAKRAIRTVSRTLSGMWDRRRSTGAPSRPDSSRGRRYRRPAAPSRRWPSGESTSRRPFGPITATERPDGISTLTRSSARTSP